jgi:O-antigen/teichoic acid export membrane protein
LTFDINNIGRNIWYTSLSTVIPSLFTFVFWFVTAKMVGPEAIGITSTIASVSIIITNFVVLDTFVGMKRSLGLAFANNDFEKFRRVIVITCIIVGSTLAITILLLINPQIQLLTTFGVGEEYLWSLLILIPALSFQLIFAEIIIASLQSGKLVLPQIVGSIIRFPLLIGFIYYFNSPTIGTIIAYSSLPVFSVIIYAIFCYKISKRGDLSFKNLKEDFKSIIAMSLSSWMPHIINILGSQLSIISVYAVEGAAAAGLFYLPMAIFSLTLFVVTSINRVIHPLISGMKIESQKQRYILYAMKISFVLTLPIAAPLTFFSSQFLSIMGEVYSDSAVTLSLFMLALPASIITEIIYYFTFALGDRKNLLYLGLAGNLPRVGLYFFLVPLLGANGAAIAYLIGTYVQLLLSIRTASRYSLKLKYFKYSAICLIPFSVSMIFWILGINFILSTLLVILISIYLYLRCHFLRANDIEKMILISLPSKLARPASRIVMRIIRTIT